ncbi:MAG: hypothetical protein JW806_06525 [Sedimentisphaerales bacterium]|nr:hypothetical protein [Sedimentisphaerales bacterium]
MKRRRPKQIKPSQDPASVKLQFEKREKNVNTFLFFLLLAFGIYQAVIYWGHQIVPHFDFNCFAVIGRELLSFQMPCTFKRVPLVGIMQVLLGKITGGQCPELPGGWLLNSIAHSLTIVFLWLTAKKLIGKTAAFFAIIAIINPWSLQLLTEAIAETTLLFFIWITLYFIFIRSKWAYLFASLTTMTRYEGATLIFAAFLMDMIYAKDKKERIMAFVYASIAAVPLALWILGTIAAWEVESGGTHYLNSLFSKAFRDQFAGGVESRVGIAMHAKMLWQVAFSTLFMVPSKDAKTFAAVVAASTKIFAVASFLFGSIYGLWKKQWKILVLLIFLLPYFYAHAKYPYPLHRYHATVFAIFVLICLYGVYNLWKLIISTGKIPRPAVIIAQAVVLITTLIWTLTLFSYLPKIAPMSKDSISLPYVSILVVCIALAAIYYAYRDNLFKYFVILSLMILMIVSNQFAVAGVVGNGERDVEFKYLLDWYIENAQPTEKMVLTVPIILQTMAPDYADNFIHTDTFDANDPAAFAEECYQRNITYIAWDSRMGLTPQNHYYKFWKMSNIAPLQAAKDIGPYQFIKQIRINQRRYINLYRLRPRPEKVTE